MHELLIWDVLLADEQFGGFLWFLLEMAVAGGEQGGRFVGV